MAGNTLAVSGSDGTFALANPPGQIEVTAAHYVTAVVTIAAGQSLNIVLRQPLETVVVTAYRSALGSSESPASTRVLDTQQLQQAASPSLDGKLREVPGFTLFRRSSSLVANPTTEGVSLRGLGSTAASRSLVVLDDIPLNDPYGGWIHWEELPELAIHSIEVVRGRRVGPVRLQRHRWRHQRHSGSPQTSGVQIFTSGGSESTLDDGALATLKRGAWSAIASGGLIATDGYTLIAPDLRGLYRSAFQCPCAEWARGS